MEQDMQSLSEAWKALPRNNAEEILVADDFYTTMIMPLSAKRFVALYGKGNKEYSLMFVTVGTSWQPVALSALAKRPKKLVFLTTVGAQANIKLAIDFMAKSNYIPLDVQIVIVDKAQSEDMIVSIRSIYAEQAEGNTCIDITGGTKAMAAAAAMVAADLDMEIFYVESNYLPVYRHPEPCSEQLVMLARPQDIEI